MTIEVVFFDPAEETHTVVGVFDEEIEQGNSDQNRDMQEPFNEEHNDEEGVPDFSEQIAANSDEEVENAEQVATDVEDEEPELMVDGDEEQFAYEDLDSRIEGLRTQHQARVEATPSLYNLPRRPVNGTFHSATAAARYEELTSQTLLIQKYWPMDDGDLLDARKIIKKAQLMYTVLDVPSFTEEIVLDVPRI